MPSFDRETLEAWRQDRITDVDIPFGLLPEQYKQILQVCLQDIADEELSLQRSLEHIKHLKYTLKCLKKKKEKIERRIR